MENEMLISVVIPLFNKEKYIKETIESVLNQTYQNFELIVVDDGSKDNSLERANEIKDYRLKVIAQENQGVSVARNTGILSANGEYISFLDADDKWDENYLETVVDLIKKQENCGFYVTAYRVQMSEQKTNYSLQKEPKEGCIDSYWTTLSGGYDFVWTSATTIKKDLLLQAELFRPGEKIGQDLDMWARVARINPKVAYSSKICVTYNRSAEENARNRVKIAYAKAFIQDLKEELIKNNHTEEEFNAIQKKYDQKMTVYIFTSLMAGQKKEARNAMKSWIGKRTKYNTVMKLGLRIAGFMPFAVLNFAYKIRLKIF